MCDDSNVHVDTTKTNVYKGEATDVVLLDHSSNVSDPDLMLEV